MKFYQKKSTFFIFILGLLTLILATGCSKKTTKKTSSNLPSAASLVGKNFKQNVQNGHYTIELASKELNQTTSASGYFKQNGPTYMDYAITNKSKKQTEQIWLTNSTLYLLLQGNHGTWLKNSADGDNFDPDQITNRFSSDTFSKINQEFIKHATVKEANTSSYSVSYNGTDKNIWKAMNVLITNTLNSPGSQNINVARTVSAAEVRNISIKYIVNKATKKISDISYQANFIINGKYDFTWNQSYDELNEHDNLKVPAKIQNKAVDVQKVKQAQANK